MRNSRLVVALVAVCCFGLFSVARAQAQVKVGDKPNLQAKSVDGEAIDLSKMGGKLVLVDFWATWCGPCMAEAPHMVEINKKYGEKGLAVIGVSLDRDAGTMKQVAKEKGLNWPQILDLNNKISGAWNVDSIPRTFLFSTDGSLLWTGHPGAGIDQQIEKAFKEHPPQLVDPKTLAEATTALEQVNSAIKSKDYAGAMKLLAHVPPAAAKDGKFAEKLADVQKSLGDFAESMLAEVDPLVQNKQYPQAIAKLRDLSNQLAGTPTGIKAKQKLSELSVDPEVRKQIDAADRAEKADAALAAAQKLKEAKQDAVAYQRFKEVTTMFANTPAAATAAEAVAQYEKDPVFVKKVLNVQTEQKAKAALGMADSYKSAGKTEQARKKYQEVIEQFPGTPQAETAKKQLAGMGGN